ncbi:MAG: T9SS type A sorting domain-containing protein [Flavobacteriales bacterium]|nr:T9SS type A sorting domain-containing protein [Flavobacteriales bacterium]MBP6697112.1 T9SS type A sorting domain-containing protein [Flavobacteriales bacterium]
MKQHLLPASLLLAAHLLAPIRTTAQLIAGGSDHSLAVCNDGSVKAWGSNSQGELGNGTNTYSNVPVQVSSLTGIVAIEAGAEHSIALKNDGTVWAWGGNGSGQLGIGTPAGIHVVPELVSSLTGITAIGAGNNHSIFLKNDGTVWASGGGGPYGQLGNGTNLGSNIPVQVSSLTGITAIESGSDHSLALKNDGTVWAWGRNLKGQLGNGTNINSNVPVQVSSLTGITAMGAGSFHSIALKTDGTVWAWGFNDYGTLGNGTNTDSNVPVQLNSLTEITAIGADGYHSIALKNDGTVWVWGWNDYGQLGNGTSTDSNVPAQVSSLTDITAIGEGQKHSIAIKNDGTVWAWGKNISGQLGNGSNTNSNVPVQVIGLCSVSIGVEERSDATSCKIFPNPTTGWFRVEHATSGAQQLEIRNVMGQEVYRSMGNASLTQIDLTSQPAGIYFLTIRTSQQATTQRLIKH